MANAIFLGTGTSFSIPPFYADYQNLTVSNFLVYPLSATTNWGCNAGHDYKDDNFNGSVSYIGQVSKSYNASTGLLSISGYRVDAETKESHAYCYLTPDNYAAFIILP